MSELAAMHGYASVTVKGHAQRRASEWRKMGREWSGPVENTGKPNLTGWQQLADKFGSMGLSVQRGGDRLVEQ